MNHFNSQSDQSEQQHIRETTKEMKHIEEETNLNDPGTIIKGGGIHITTKRTTGCHHITNVGDTKCEIMALNNNNKPTAKKSTEE